VAITFGKIEGQITVPTGGWTGSVNDGGGADVFTVAAGTYYHSSPGSGAADLIATLELALEAATGSGWTCSIAAGEGGTGLVTIAINSGTASVAWTSTDMRDALGFTGDMGAAASHVSPRQARSLWLPDCPIVSPYGANDAGTDVAASAHMVSPSGHVTGVRTARAVASWLRWSACAGAKTRIQLETTVNTSFQKFWRDTIEGTAGWAAQPFGPIRVHWDADDDATYKAYKVAGRLAQTFEPTQVSEGWTGLWEINMDRIYEVP